MYLDHFKIYRKVKIIQKYLDRGTLPLEPSKTSLKSGSNLLLKLNESFSQLDLQTP